MSLALQPSLSRTDRRPPVPGDATRAVPPVDSEWVDDDATASVWESRWPLGASQQSGLLLLDPAGCWAGSILRALAQATGEQPHRMRILAPTHLDEVATVDEIQLPSVRGRPDVVRHLRSARLAPALPSPSLERLWRHTGQVALMVGTLEPEEAARWVLSACALMNRLGHAGPSWTVFMRTAQADDVPAELKPAWMRRVRFLPQPGAAGQAASVSAVWNAIFRAWVSEHGS